MKDYVLKYRQAGGTITYTAIKAADPETALASAKAVGVAMTIDDPGFRVVSLIDTSDQSQLALDVNAISMEALSVGNALANAKSDELDRKLTE